MTQPSAGPQQRVALARSLVLEPKSLPLDEPFASPDFGTQKIVDIDLANGLRLKAMIAPGDMIRAGMLITSSCSGFSPSATMP